MLKEVLLSAIALCLLAAAFLVGKASAPPAPQAPQAVVQTPAAPPQQPLLPPVKYTPGDGSGISLYNPDGRLLKFFEIRGEVEKTAQELVFDTADGKRVHTNAIYILEGQAKPK